MDKEAPDSKGILVAVLLTDMLNTICREIIVLSATGDSDRRAAGIATAVLFVLELVFFFGTLATITITYHCCKSTKYGPIKIVLVVMEVCGAILYFYGDNVGVIFTQYGEALGCDQQCVEDNRIVEILALGLALMFYQLFPSCVRKIAEFKKVEVVHTGWFSASDMLITILKIDALFTVVAIMAQTDEFCSKIDVSISVAFYVISVVVGISLMFVYSIISALELRRTPHTKQWYWIAPLTFVILLICFPMYVLADNLQPLDCAWGCDSFASNMTINDLNCNTVGNSALRLGFTLISFISIGTLSLLLFCCRQNTKGEATAKAV